jgi:putative glycosyltransferase (TIGR04372 family)
MKYGIWRHENALGNGAEHVINLAQTIKLWEDDSPEVYVENDWQRMMARCIPNITDDKIKLFPDLASMEYKSSNWLGFNNLSLQDIYMPGVYPFIKTYPAGWNNLLIHENPPLVFPVDDYKNIHALPKDVIVITLREHKTHWKREEGDSSEHQRYVKIDTFHKLALYYADLGYKVVRIGSNKETDFPKHENIIDFAKYTNRTLLDDLYLIDNSRVFISTDSGIWPMACGLKRKTVVTNVSYYGNQYTQWVPKETTSIMFKENLVANLSCSCTDNNINDIIKSVERFL